MADYISIDIDTCRRQLQELRILFNKEIEIFNAIQHAPAECAPEWRGEAFNNFILYFASSIEELEEIMVSMQCADEKLEKSLTSVSKIEELIF